MHMISCNYRWVHFYGSDLDSRPDKDHFDRFYFYASTIEDDKRENLTFLWARQMSLCPTEGHL
jgi:hypothetical protein